MFFHGQLQSFNELLHEIIWQKYANNFLVLEIDRYYNATLQYNDRPGNIS